MSSSLHIRLPRFTVILALAASSAACGSSAQRAVVSPLPPPAPLTETTTTPPRPLETVPEARRYNLDPSRTRLEMFASDIITGEHRGWFTRWKGHVDIVPANDGRRENIPTVGAIASITAEIETDSLEVDLAGATDFVKQKLLEVGRFPSATLSATLSRASDGPASKHVVQGTADLHGVKKKIRFVGDLTKEGESYRFKTSFVISRKDFDVRYGPVEPFLKDDVRIVLDGIANPEKVTAEEILENGGG